MGGLGGREVYSGEMGELGGQEVRDGRVRGTRGERWES